MEVSVEDLAAESPRAGQCKPRLQNRMLVICLMRPFSGKGVGLVF